jgi:hypothetical protein
MLNEKQLKKQMSESKLQTRCIKYAKKTLSNVVIGRSSTEGFPDRMFFWNGGVFCVEFKDLGKKPRPTQIEKHRELYQAGTYTFTIDCYEDFKELISMALFPSPFMAMTHEFYDKCCYYDKSSGETVEL